jgi:hypothetical protein
MAHQAKRMHGFVKPKYFKPNEFFHNASNFNKAPIGNQYREHSTNLVNEAILKQSLQATLKKTNVWKDDITKFKLNGAGTVARLGSTRSISPMQSMRSSVTKTMGGH